MVTLLLDSSRLEVALSATEHALAFQKENIRVERSLIAKVQLTDDPWTWLTGVRTRGTFIPGVVAAGSWESIAGTDFAFVRGRRAGVVIDLEPGAPFRRLVLTTRHGVALVKALRLDGAAEPEDVAEIVAPRTRRAAKARPATA